MEKQVNKKVVVLLIIVVLTVVLTLTAVLYSRKGNGGNASKVVSGGAINYEEVDRGLSETPEEITLGGDGLGDEAEVISGGAIGIEENTEVVEENTEVVEESAGVVEESTEVVEEEVIADADKPDVDKEKLELEEKEIDEEIKILDETEVIVEPTVIDLENMNNSILVDTKDGEKYVRIQSPKMLSAKDSLSILREVNKNSLIQYITEVDGYEVRLMQYQTDNITTEYPVVQIEKDGKLDLELNSLASIVKYNDVYYVGVVNKADTNYSGINIVMGINSKVLKFNMGDGSITYWYN